MALTPGTCLGPYEILAPLGAGGMGEVWRARDTRLGREVAVKVLPDEVARNASALSRFQHEAQAVAALSHPNILALFDVGEASGVHFAVTELLEGESLRTALVRGLLPRKRALDIATQVTDALAAAHEKGIVHRDVKPENVFLTKDGRSKLLDFGIARQLTPAGATDTVTPTVTALSEPGVLLGTVAYMSPEQARGEAVDFRSDQFSLGALLYEMFAGRRPFGGGSPSETLAAILRDEPESLERLAPAVPAPIRWIVERCLAKEPGGRYESTRDLGRDLENCRVHLADIGSGVAGPAIVGVRPARRLIAAVLAGIALVAILAVLTLRQKNATPTRPSTPLPAGPLRIVVLPFENLGGPEDGYFASGMTEEITSRLSNVKTLAVISRTSATQYDRKGKTVEQIGKDLGVGYVLEGSVRWDKSGGGAGRVRITPQLVRVSDDTHLWSERYDRQLADIFAIQGDVADGVVRALNLTLAPAEPTLREAPTRDLGAYDLYLRALELEKRSQNASALAQQIKLAGEAVERDPQFAEALALLSKARISNYWLYYDRRASELERARIEAERAVVLRPDAAETHLALGAYHYHGRLDYEAALGQFSKAVAIQPNNAVVHLYMGSIRRRQGRMDDAEAEIRKAVDGDPRNGVVYFNLGETQVLAHKYSDAIQSLEVSALLVPTYALAHTLRAGATVRWKGDLAAAAQILERARKTANLEDPYGAVEIGFLDVGLCSRDWEGVLRRLATLPTEFSRGRPTWYEPTPLRRAQVLSYMGRRDEARASFEEARRHLTAKIAEAAPEDARFHSSLGIALAGLGRSAEAVQEGERGVALMPPSRDAFRGIARVQDLALIFTMLGSQEAAIEHLDYLLSHPSWISVPLLKLDPRWDPLRKNPKFEALLAKNELKP